MLGLERRVVITGLGFVTPLGDAPEPLWDRLAAGQGALRRIEEFPVAGLPNDVVAEIRDFDFIKGYALAKFRKTLAKSRKYMARDIQLDRGDSASASAAMATCRERLEQRVSVMIFPEGTRSASGDMLPFKDGAFRLAIETGVPILPLAVHGTRTALRKNDWRYGRSVAEVRVLEPVPTEGLGLDDVAELRERVRDTIAAEVARMAQDRTLTDA